MSLKPWTQTTVLFTSEATCLVIFLVYRLIHSSTSPAELRTDLTSSRIFEICRLLPLFLLLAVFEMAGNTLGGIGLVYIPSSLFQMFRGFNILFTALWSKLIFHRNFGIIKILGLVLVSISCIFLILHHISHIGYRWISNCRYLGRNWHK